MCYTGKCKYEITSGPDTGDCTIPWDTDYPDDAACMEAEREMRLEEQEKAEEERRMWNWHLLWEEWKSTVP